MNDIVQLEQQLHAALNRISKLEAEVQAIRKNTNQAITGHASILESLVDHTRYVPAANMKLAFPRAPVDVGGVI